MLEQLPGAHQLKQYSFKYNPPFDITSLEGTAEQVSYFENVMSFFYRGRGCILSLWQTLEDEKLTSLLLLLVPSVFLASLF